MWEYSAPVPTEPFPCGVERCSRVGPQAAHGDTVAEGCVAQTPGQLAIVPRLVATPDVVVRQVVDVSEVVETSAIYRCNGMVHLHINLPTVVFVAFACV